MLSDNWPQEFPLVEEGWIVKRGIAIVSMAGVLLCCSGTPQGKGHRADVEFSAVSKAIARGDLRFEMRGLGRKAETPDYGGTSYYHTGTVVAMGDSALVKLPFILIYAVTRISGGDPDSPRPQGDEYWVAVLDGVADFAEYGGYRSPGEDWDPEVIEVRLVGVVPGVPIESGPIRSQG